MGGEELKKAGEMLCYRGLFFVWGVFGRGMSCFAGRLLCRVRGRRAGGARRIGLGKPGGKSEMKKNKTGIIF